MNNHERIVQLANDVMYEAQADVSGSGPFLEDVAVHLAAFVTANWDDDDALYVCCMEYALLLSDKPMRERIIAALADTP